MANKIVLKGLSATNFGSFAEKMTFTTVVDKSKKESEINAFKEGDDYINKVSFIYGANGAGKTYFCKVLREMQRMIFVSPFSMMEQSQKKAILQNDDITRSVPYFMFDTEYKEMPTNLSIDISIDGTSYHYEFSIKGKKIVYELLTKKYRRTEKLLERKSPSYQDITLRSELKSFESTKNVVREDALCLAMAAILNNEFAQKIATAITEISISNMTNSHLDPKGPEAFSKERIDKYVKVLQKADPTIRDMQVEFAEEEISRQKIESDDFENRSVIQTKTTVKVKTTHAMFDHGVETGEGNDQIEFFVDESLGTVKLFTVLPHLFDVLEEGGVMILDEIENGFHPYLVKNIISLFLSPASNPHNAQLICTTHQPLLISDNTKRDQVWIISKNECGKSSIARLSDKKFNRAKVNITNQILEGAFGCNPESFF